MCWLLMMRTLLTSWLRTMLIVFLASHSSSFPKRPTRFHRHTRAAQFILFWNIFLEKADASTADAGGPRAAIRRFAGDGVA